MNVWNEIFVFAKSRAPMSIETTLLGRVPVSVVNGSYKAEIPWRLQESANKHGLKIVGADFKRGVYILKIMEP